MARLLRTRDYRFQPRHLKSFHVRRPYTTSSEPAGLCAHVYSDFIVRERQVAEPSKWKKVNARKWGITGSMIPPPPWKVLRILRVRGFDSYLVGGCVRDLLLSKEPKDFDIITTAKLTQVKNEFRRSNIIGQRFPICRVLIQGTAVEVSSFQTVSQHAEEKEKVLLSNMPDGCDEKDFIRWRDSTHRDFTINSLFYDPFKNVIYDYTNGMKDLKTLELRTLIPAQLSFQEDCARILRGLRIAGRLGLTISKDTAAAMHEYSSLISNLGKFRMMMEMNYMLSYGAAKSTISLLQRFHLLDKILPFHAAYLDQQAEERCASNCMMMNLFSNLDKLFSCNRPCPSTLWIGLLAFHQALAVNPQDGLVIWTFASVLYHGNWKKGIRFARENVKVQVAPEISGFNEGKLDEELVKEVAQMASLVQNSVHALTDAEPMSKYISKFPVSPYSSTVFVPRTIGRKVAELFDVFMNGTAFYKKERLTFVLDYHLLGSGDAHETGFALGKVILETLSSEIPEGMKVSREEQEVIEENLPQVLEEELIDDKECEDLMEGQTIEEKGCQKLPGLMKYLVTVKDGILASLRGEHTNGNGEQEAVDGKGYKMTSQYVKSLVMVKERKEIRKAMDVVKKDMKNVKENKLTDCVLLKQDEKQTHIKMVHPEHLLQQEKREDHALQHKSGEKTDQFRAALVVEKVTRKQDNKRPLASVQGPKPKKLKDQKSLKLETCDEQEIAVVKVVQKEKAAETLSVDDRMKQEELYIASGSLSEMQQKKVRKPAKKVKQGKRNKLHGGKNKERATSSGRNLKKDDRVEKEKKKYNHSPGQNFVRNKTKEPKEPKGQPLSSNKEDGEKRDDNSPRQEAVRSKGTNRKGRGDQPSSSSKEEKKDRNKLLHEMLKEKAVRFKSTLVSEKKAQLPLSKLFR